MAKIVGLTGGIGSGKSTVADLFNQLGVPVYISDFHAKQITNLPTTLQSIREIFGDQVFEGNELNRSKLGSLVFNNPQLLSQLNDIIHPLVAEHFQEWLDRFQHHQYIIKESAIIFEMQQQHNFDAIICVTAPLEIRIERITKRDQLPISEIENRLKNQLDDSIKIAGSNYVINNISLEKTREEVVKIDRELKS